MRGASHEIHLQEEGNRYIFGRLDGDLDEEIQAFVGCGKHDILLHHLNVKTRGQYKRNWERWESSRYYEAPRLG